jgi:hypothetical protein
MKGERVCLVASLSPERASLLGRIGALVLHARHDAKATTAKARETFLNKFEKEVDPDGTLPPEERARRAEYARKAHFAHLALKSADARRAKRSSSTTKEDRNGRA